MTTVDASGQADDLQPFHATPAVPGNPPPYPPRNRRVIPPHASPRTTPARGAIAPAQPRPFTAQLPAGVHLLLIVPPGLHTRSGLRPPTLASLGRPTCLFHPPIAPSIHRQPLLHLIASCTQAASSHMVSLAVWYNYRPRRSLRSNRRTLRHLVCRSFASRLTHSPRADSRVHV